MAQGDNPLDWTPSKMMSPEDSVIQREMAEATAKKAVTLSDDVAELLVEGWPTVERFFSGKLPDVSDDALQSLLAKAYEIQLRDGEEAAAKAFRDGLGVGKKSRAHIDALMREINLVSDKTLGKSATKAAQLAINDPAKFAANLTDEISVLTSEANIKRRATNFEKVMSLGETKKPTTLMEAIRGRKRKGLHFPDVSKLTEIASKANALQDKYPEGFSAEKLADDLEAGGYLVKDPELEELQKLARSGPAGTATAGDDYARFLARQNMAAAPHPGEGVKTIDTPFFNRTKPAPTRRPIAPYPDAASQVRMVNVVDPTKAPRAIGLPDVPLRKVDSKTFVGILNGHEVEIKRLSKRTFGTSINGELVNTSRTYQKALNSAKRKTNDLRKTFMAVATQSPSSVQAGLNARGNVVPYRVPGTDPNAGSALARRPGTSALAIRDADPRKYPLALRPNEVASEAASGGLFKALGRFAKRHPIASAIGMGLGGELAFSGAMVGYRALDHAAGSSLREAQERATPSTRELIERLYLQKRAKESRAKEMQANPHLARYEQHQAELAAGQVPGMVTF